MSRSDIRVSIALVDRFSPEVLRVRYKFLTPIGHRIPPKGTIRRDQLILAVRVRQAGRALLREVPVLQGVPWTEVGRTWMRRLEILGAAYLIVVAIIVVLVLSGVLR